MKTREIIEGLKYSIIWDELSKKEKNEVIHDCISGKTTLHDQERKKLLRLFSVVPIKYM